MGFELEATAPVDPADLESDGRHQALERRWQLANERLAAALGGYRELCGRLGPEEPAWVAAQLRLAQARQRVREASDDLELFLSDLRLSPAGA